MLPEDFGEIGCRVNPIYGPGFLALILRLFCVVGFVGFVPY